MEFPQLICQLGSNCTDFERTREQLQEAVEEWTRIFASTPGLIAIVDTEYRFTQVNFSLACALKLSPKECIGLHCYVVFHGRTERCEDCCRQRVLRTLKPEKREHFEPSLGKYVQLTVSPLNVATGAISKTVHVAHDITPQMERLKILQDQRHQLESLNTVLESRIAEGTEALSQVNMKLRGVSQNMEKKCEAIRKQISRTLHDEIGQLLVATKFELEKIRKIISPLSQVHMPLDTIDEYLSYGLERVQHIVAELRPSILDDLGFYEAIKWQAEKFTERTGVKSRVVSCPYFSRLTKEQEIILFRITQEALNNVARHAAATQVTIDTDFNDQILTFRITDDGRGITDSQRHATDSYGLMGIAERAVQVGASAEIKALSEGGTVVRIYLPL